MKKIGIVTLYGPGRGGNTNYGFTLQAYALQQTLKKLNFESDILAIIVNQSISAKLERNFKLLRKNPVACIKKIIRKIIVKLESIIYVKEYKGLKTRECVVNKFKSKYIKTSREIEEEFIDAIVDDYDAFITGSDQVFNPAYWINACLLDFVPDDKPKISYAASIAVTSYSPEQELFVKKNLQRFDAISVREQSACQLLESIVDREIVHVLDPTLLLSAKDWEKIHPWSGINERYLFCYLLGDNKLHREYAKMFAKKMNLKLVTVCGDSFQKNDRNFGDVRIYDADSARFIGLIRDAEIILTDSFHGTVFSIIYKKNFYTLQRTIDSDKKSMNSRLYDLLDMFELQNRMITDTDFDWNIKITEDEIFKDVDEILNDKKEKSKLWLKNAIEEAWNYG